MGRRRHVPAPCVVGSARRLVRPACECPGASRRRKPELPPEPWAAAAAGGPPPQRAPHLPRRRHLAHAPCHLHTCVNSGTLFLAARLWQRRLALGANTSGTRHACTWLGSGGWGCAASASRQTSLHLTSTEGLLSGSLGRFTCALNLEGPVPGLLGPCHSQKSLGRYTSRMAPYFSNLARTSSMLQRETGNEVSAAGGGGGGASDVREACSQRAAALCIVLPRMPRGALGRQGKAGSVDAPRIRRVLPTTHRASSGRLRTSTEHRSVSGSSRQRPRPRERDCERALRGERLRERDLDAIVSGAS